MAGGIKVKADNMRAAALQGFATATDLADYLVKQGVPFRDAHEVVAHAVRDCEQRGCDLADLPLADLKAYHPRSEEHTSELQSLMRISYAVFCLKTKELTPRDPIQHTT